ncbi:unnamed protein product [Symbiodinium sp. CCMP2592]|nr:unnamed protein product [Symbiodinium sp. CCMP2592]
MPRQTATHCTRCKRPFGKIPNPCVLRPEEGDLLQRRGTTANCQSCFAFGLVCPKFKGLPAKKIQEAIDADPTAYQQDLSDHEAARREGRRYKGEKATSVTAESRQGMQTRRLLGYLWSESLLRKHNISHLWNSLPKQSVNHMGKMQQGVLRETFAAGAIEVYETSDTQAVRSQVAAECEADEVEQADKVFQELGAGLKLQAVDQETTEDGAEAGIVLKNPPKRAKTDADEDDFMQIWGVASLTSASSSRAGKHDKAPRGKGSGKSNQKDLKELDATEKLLGQHDNFRKYLSHESSFMSLTYQKVYGHSEKLFSRNTPELQKIYRELTNGQTDGRACQIMKRLATAETMLEGLTEARGAGLEIPAAAEKFCMARLLLQYCKGGKVSQFFSTMESSDLTTLFKDNPDGMTEFRFCSLKSAVTTLLNAELEAPGFENSAKDLKESGNISAEQKAENESKRSEAMQKVALDRMKLLLDFIDNFKASNVCEDWSDKQKDNVRIVQWLEDISRLHLLVSSALTDEGEAVTAEKVEELKGARNLLLNKKSNFAESMTLWPLGQFIQQKANSRVEAYLRDQSLKADLAQCIQLSTQLKTFSTDSLFKTDSLEIMIPGSNKVVEMVQKLALIEQLGSKSFLQDNEEQIRLVTIKIVELQNAILSASVHKFRKSIGEKLLVLLTSLSEGKIDTDQTAQLVEQLNEAKNFNPMQVNVINKCLGAWAGPIQEALQVVRTFWTRFASATPAIVGLMNIQSVACAVQRLLCADLVATMEIFNDASKMQHVQKICVDLGPMMTQIGDKIRGSAMQLLAKESSSFLQFTSFLARPRTDEASAEEGLVKDVVGEFQGDEDKVMVDYCGMFSLYGKHLPADFVCIDFKAASGESVPLCCAAICAAGACLPLAKMVVHIATWTREFRDMQVSGQVVTSCPVNPAEAMSFFAKSRMQLLGEKSQETAKFMHTLRIAYEAAELTGQETAHKFVVSCANKAPQLLGKVIDMVTEDIKSMIAILTDLYSNVKDRDEFNSALDEGILDGALGASLCNDESLQKMYRFLAFGLDSFTGLKQVMIGISGAATLLGKGSFDMSGFEVTTATAKAVIQTIQEFSGSHESGSGSGEGLTLQTICTMVANATMVQACTRELKTGETRTSLVNKAWSGIKKRQWKLHPSLTQRCTEILSGKDDDTTVPTTAEPSPLTSPRANQGLRGLLGSKARLKALEEDPNSPIDLAQLAIFSGLSSEFIHWIQENLEPRIVFSDDTLFGEGEKTENLYIVCKGSICLEKKQPETFSRGSYFGDSHLLGVSEGAVATAVSLEMSLVQVLSRQVLLRGLAQFPSEAEHFDNLTVNYLESQVDNVLHHAPAFADCCEEFRKKVSSLMRTRLLRTDECLVKKGAKRGSLFVVRTGIAVVDEESPPVAKPSDDDASELSGSTSRTRRLQQWEVVNADVVLGLAAKAPVTVKAAGLMAVAEIEDERFIGVLRNFPLEVPKIIQSLEGTLWPEEAEQVPSFLNNMGQSYFSQLTQEAEWRMFLPDRNVVRQGMEGNALFLLCYGRAICAVDDVVLGQPLARGEVVGRANFLGLKPRYGVTVKAQTVCHFRVITHEQLLELLTSQLALREWFELAKLQVRHFTEYDHERQKVEVFRAKLRRRTDRAWRKHVEDARAARAARMAGRGLAAPVVTEATEKEDQDAHRRSDTLTSQGHGERKDSFTLDAVPPRPMPTAGSLSLQIPSEPEDVEAR